MASGIVRKSRNRAQIGEPFAQDGVEPDQQMRTLLLAILTAFAATAEPLTQTEKDQAFALGRRCQAPIARVASGQFDVYVESPLARTALVIATATINHRPLDAPGVIGAMTADYRIWAVYRDEADRTVSVSRIGVRPIGGAERGPLRTLEWERLFLGIGSSHGIIEPLRLRPGEAIYDSLPSGDFQIVLHTTAGVLRPTVTAAARSALLRVCN